MSEDAKRGPGRPPAEIDPAKVENAAGIGCTVEEIAAVLGVGLSTLKDRLQRDDDLAAALERGREKGKATLRRLQWQAANDGNATMLIWLGKQMLGQKDKQDVTVRKSPLDDLDAGSLEALRDALADGATDADAGSGSAAGNEAAAHLPPVSEAG